MTKRRRDKAINIRTARDFGFVPVLSDLSDNSTAGVGGRYVRKVRCLECGKLYAVRSSTWQLRHWMNAHDHKASELI